MIRQDIRIGDYSNNGKVDTSYKYIVDFYRAGVDYKEVVYNKFVMLRKYRIVNDIVYDTDIYLVEKELLQEGNVVFPMTNGSFTGFSDDPAMFNANYQDEAYDLYIKDADGNMQEAGIPCDKINIYHPHNKTELQSVIYIDVMVNAVKFHILCRKYLDYQSNAENDFSVDGVNYSEYVTCYFPDIDYLLSDGKVYYKEDITIVDTPYTVEVYPDDLISTEVSEPLETEDVNDRKLTKKIVDEPGISYVNTEATDIVNTDGRAAGESYENCTFLIEEAGREWRKYNPDDLKKELILSPFNGMSPDGNEYVALKLYTIPFVIDEETPGKFVKKYILNMNDSVARDYVAWPIRVTIYPYTYIDDITKIYINDSHLETNSDVMQDNAMMSLASKFGFDDNHVPSVVCTFQFPGKDRFSSFAEAYEYFYGVNLQDYEGIVEYDEDCDEDDYVEQKQCGFRMAIFTDWKMQSELYHEYFEIEHPDEELDDFSFNLNKIFEKWEQLPDTLIVRTQFIDKWLGNIISSNPVLISTEMFKYMVCDDEANRSIVKWNGTERRPETIEDMDLSNINFIDKIHCTVVRKGGDVTPAPAGSNAPRIVYKPVFYRTQDLQSIKLRSSLVQNVGIALAEYMTKVDSFRLTIGGQEIGESARNDIYVIFSINAQSLGEKGATGEYHISNKDGEYISTGTYEII